jgi:hypothetical protein
MILEHQIAKVITVGGTPPMRKDWLSINWWAGVSFVQYTENLSKLNLLTSKLADKKKIQSNSDNIRYSRKWRNGRG